MGNGCRAKGTEYGLPGQVGNLVVFICTKITEQDGVQVAVKYALAP